MTTLGDLKKQTPKSPQEIADIVAEGAINLVNYLHDLTHQRVVVAGRSSPLTITFLTEAQYQGNIVDIGSEANTIAYKSFVRRGNRSITEEERTEWIVHHLSQYPLLSDKQKPLAFIEEHFKSGMKLELMVHRFQEAGYKNTLGGAIVGRDPINTSFPFPYGILSEEAVNFLKFYENNLDCLPVHWDDYPQYLSTHPWTLEVCDRIKTRLS